MSFVFADRAGEVSVIEGLGPYLLTDSKDCHQGIVDAIGDGNSSYFCAEDGTDWEVFRGTITAGTPDSLSRDAIVASSNAGAAVNWAAGSKNVVLVLPAMAIQRMIPTPDIVADLDFNGDWFTAPAGENVVIGDDCYLKPDGKFWKADATDETKNGLHAMATGTIATDASGIFLRKGFIRNDLWARTVGATLYTPTTPGNPSEAYPAAGHAGVGYGKIIGHAYSATIIFCDPENGFRNIGAARLVFGGGSTGSDSNILDFITITTEGNASDFGDLTVARRGPGACSSSIVNLFGGGSTGSDSNVIDYVLAATIASATDFGDLTVARYSVAACSSLTRGLFGGGTGGTNSNVIDFVIMTIKANAVDFGDLAAARRGIGAGGSSVRALFGGGYNGSTYFNIEHVTIATAGNTTTFGDLTVARGFLGACSSTVRCLFGAGYTGAYRDIIDYVTIATEGNATDFGDVTVARGFSTACGSLIRGLFGGGTTGSNSNVIDHVTIATTGNAADFGDLTVARQYLSGCSNGHGGLA